MLVRCSSLKLAMTYPRSKKDNLSESAKKLVEDEIRAKYFGVREKISSKPMQKGIECEQDGIDLLNLVEFAEYQKNTERKTNEFITGECDIYDPVNKLIRDIKLSWSVSTFPLFATDCDYEWQMRGYMWLWGCDIASVDFCLVDTPPHLIGYEQEDLHIVSHIDPFKRVKSFVYERDAEKEEKIKARVEQMQAYYFDLESKFLLV